MEITPMLKSTQPVTLRTKNDLFAYINMWKSICKKGIQYYDIYNYDTDTPIDEEKIKEDSKFIEYKQSNANKNFEMHETELALCEALKSKDNNAYQNYIILQSKAAQHLLHLTENTPESTAKLSQYINEIKTLSATYPEAAACLAMLKSNKIIVTDKLDLNIMPLRRYALYLKLQFVSAASDLLIQNTDSFENRNADEFEKLSQLLLNDCDLDYDSLNSIIPAQQPKVQTIAPANTPMLGDSQKTDYKKEYVKLAKELDDLNKDLKTKALEIKSTTTEKERKKIFNDINRLNHKKEVLSYVTEQHYKKSGLINKAEVSAKSWISDNLFDKKKAGKDAAKVFFCTTGAAIGKSIFYSLTNQSHKIDSKKVREDIINGLIETGLTAVGSYFLGPLGGSFTKQIMPFFREEPADPYLEEFKAIKKQLSQLSDGVTRIENKLNAISEQITTQLNSVASKLEAHTVLAARKNAFISRKDEIIKSLKYIDQTYNDVFLNRSTVIDDTELSKLDEKLQADLITLISILYHDKYKLTQETEEIEEPGNDSLCSMFIKFNQEPSVSFHFIAGNLLRICDDIVNIGEIYLDLREKWLTLISVNFLFFKNGKTTDTNQLFHKYWNAHKERDNFNANLSIELNTLKLYIVGTNNLELLKSIERALDADNRQVDFLGGFGLETISGKAEEKAKLYGYEFENDYSPKGKFIQQADRSFIHRYVVANFTLESQSKSYYTVYSQQNNQVPVPIHLHLRLMPKDTLGILNIENNDTHLARVISPSNVSELANSIEAFFAKEKSVVLNESLQTTFELPVKDYYLSISCVSPYTQATVTVYRRDKIKKIIGLYTYAINFNESFSTELDNPLQIELTPVRTNKHASIELNIFRAADKKKAKVSIILSDYEAIKKAGLARGIEGVATYTLKMPVLLNGNIKETDVRTDNMRPFISNLILVGDEFKFQTEERDHFGEIVQGNTNWQSINGKNTLQAVNNNTAWFVQLCVFENLGLLGSELTNIGSVFNEYNYTNKYSGYFLLQPDGNFVMYDSTRQAMAATGTHGDKNYVKFAYLNNEGYLVIVNKDNKEVKKFQNKSPKTTVKGSTSNKHSNQLLSNEKLSLDKDSKIESENGEYYAKFTRTQAQVESDYWNGPKHYKFSLTLYNKKGDIVKTALNSSNFNEYNLYHSLYMIMQTDGNLVAYHQESQNTYGVLFASHTHASDHAGCTLCITNKGKLFLAHTGKRKIIKWLVE